MLLTRENFGCAGCKQWLFNIASRSREDFVKFLVDEEGLKATHELMHQWLDNHQGYEPEYPNVFIGPLIKSPSNYLKTITFYVNPDQLSLLITGAQYSHTPGDYPPVIAPFGSGCMQLVYLFADSNRPQALIGGTDIAMRQYLPSDIVAFTVTKPMFEQLCALDEQSFLYKPFWERLQKARKVK